jgi:hypothetical protein
MRLDTSETAQSASSDREQDRDVVILDLPAEHDTAGVSHHHQIFITSKRRALDPAVMLGQEFGRGKVVLLTTPSLLSNETARGVPPAVATVRALQWMDGFDRPLIVDEYHQGYGIHANIPKAMWRMLTTTRPGWALLQGTLAVLILLAALGNRPLAPVPEPRVQRRSVLEHVSALANAYAQTDARTFGLDQLIRGMRRRHPLGVNRGVAHERYFDVIRANFPQTANDVSALLDMHRGSTPINLAAAATFVAHIENQFPGARSPERSTPATPTQLLSRG